MEEGGEQKPNTGGGGGGPGSDKGGGGGSNPPHRFRFSFFFLLFPLFLSCCCQRFSSVPLLFCPFLLSCPACPRLTDALSVFSLPSSVENQRAYRERITALHERYLPVLSSRPAKFIPDSRGAPIRLDKLVPKPRNIKRRCVGAFERESSTARQSVFELLRGTVPSRARAREKTRARAHAQAAAANHF